MLLHLPNCLAQPVLKLGVWAAGLTATTINSALKPAEVAYIINNSRPACLITLAGEGGIDIVLEAMQHVEDKSLVKQYLSGNIFTVDMSADDYGLASASAPKQLQVAKQANVRDWKWLMDAEPAEEQYPVYDASKKESERRAALILWSSGTSGKSKGVVLSHSAIAASVQSLWYGNLDFNAHEVNKLSS